MRMKTDGVDISPEAVESLTSRFEAACQRITKDDSRNAIADMIRALRTALTASESVLRRIATGADRCLGIGSDAECRISLEVVMDMARAILAKGETK